MVLLCQSRDKFEPIENTTISALELFLASEEGTLACGKLVLPHLPKLKTLKVYSRAPYSFPEENFKNMPLLENLRLINLGNLPSKHILSTNVRILNISIYTNNFNNDLSTILSQFPNLEYFGMSGSHSFLLYFLTINKNLEVLNVSSCGINNIPLRGIFFLVALHTFDASHNEIRNISSITIPKSLRKLILNHNKLTSFSFAPDVNNELELLDLSNNQLLIVSSFSERMVIEALGISNHTYKTIIASNCTVRYLNVSNNRIRYWTDSKQFSFVTKELNMSGNELTHLTETMVSSLIHLQKVDLQGNPFECNDCRIKPIQTFLSQHKQLVARNITCYSPLETKGKLIQDVECPDPNAHLWLAAGIPVGIVLFVLLVVGLIAYCFRFKIIYITHLYSLRKGRRNESSDVKYDAFVCYSAQDRDWVKEEFVPMLEADEQRYRVCLHDRDFLLGSHINRNIVNAIDRSRRTIIVLSSHFVVSRWCQWELDMATHKMFEESRNFVILLVRERMDRSLLPRHLKHMMDTRTYLEWYGDASPAATKTAMKRLKEALGQSIWERNGRSTERRFEIVEYL